MNITAAVLLATVLLGSERPVSAPSYGPAYGTQYPHELVSDGEDFLAVWTGIDGVYAAAVDEHGAAHPTPPRALFEGFNVRAAWAGDAYVLVWQADGRVWTARVNRDAQLLSTPAVIAEDAMPMAIGTLDDRVLVVLSRSADNAAVLIDAQGTILRKDIALTTAARIYAASVAGTAGGFVVATIETVYWGSPATVAGVLRLSADGSAAGTRTLAEIPSNVNSIDVAADGDRVGVAFVARRNMPNGVQRLYAFTVDARTLDSTAHGPRVVSGDDPQVVPTPEGFAAGMLDTGFGTPLTLTTIPFATGAQRVVPLGSNTPGADLRMATNGRKVLSVWRDYRFSRANEYSTMNMFGIALDAAAAQAETGILPVAISAVAQASPSIASAGTASLVSWMDLTKTVRGNVMARRVDGRGNPLDAEPFVIAADVDGVQRPVVVFTGEVWIVAWYAMTNSNAYMRRIGRNGAILDATPVDLGRGSVSAAASNGTVTLLAIGNKLLRFSPAGERLGTATLPDAAPYAGALASNGQEFLVAWDEGSDWWQFPSPNLRDVRAIRLDASGNPMDAAPIDIAMSRANEVDPIVTSDGTDFLVVYGHLTEDWTVRAKRVLRTGVLADHTSLDAGSLVGSGQSSYAVAPREGGYTAVFARPLPWAAAVDAVPLDVSGAAVEEPVTLVITRWLGGLAPAVAIAGTTAVYTKSDDALANINRVFVRPVGAEPGRRRPIRK